MGHALSAPRPRHPAKHAPKHTLTCRGAGRRCGATSGSTSRAVVYSSRHLPSSSPKSSSPSKPPPLPPPLLLVRASTATCGRAGAARRAHGCVAHRWYMGLVVRRWIYLEGVRSRYQASPTAGLQHTSSARSSQGSSRAQGYAGGLPAPPPPALAAGRAPLLHAPCPQWPPAAAAWRPAGLQDNGQHQQQCSAWAAGRGALQRAQGMKQRAAQAEGSGPLTCRSAAVGYL